MGTEVAASFSSLRAQLENERSTLYKIDANIKKIVQNPGRHSDRFKNPNADYGRGNPRLGARNSFPDTGNHHRNDDFHGNKKGDTKTVFSRLSGRIHDSDGEEESPGGKRIRMSSAVSRELPSRAEVVRAQGGDEQARTRNRRIFGSLLGTLQKFKQEEIGLQTKEDKRAQVEKKIEEQARQQKEKEIIERKTLFAEREHKKATIRALEAKVARMEEFERCEASQKSLGNFILTKARPHLYWLPKKMSEKAEEKLSSSRSYYEKTMAKKRTELQDELQWIEQRCLRPRGPGAKENDPDTTDDQLADVKHGDHDDSDVAGNKRDKFAMDEDDKEKEDSDNEEHHEKQATDSAPETDNTAPAEADTEDIKMDTSESQPNPEAPEQQLGPEPAEESAAGSPGNSAADDPAGSGDSPAPAPAAQPAPEPEAPEGPPAQP